MSCTHAGLSMTSCSNTDEPCWLKHHLDASILMHHLDAQMLMNPVWLKLHSLNTSALQSPQASLVQHPMAHKYRHTRQQTSPGRRRHTATRKALALRVALRTCFFTRWFLIMRRTTRERKRRLRTLRTTQSEESDVWSGESPSCADQPLGIKEMMGSNKKTDDSKLQPKGLQMISHVNCKVIYLATSMLVAEEF